MTETPALRTEDLTDEQLAAEARHLRTLAGLERPGLAQYTGAWNKWGVAEVVSVQGAPRRSLQVGETVLIAPYLCGAPTVMVHSKIRADDILVPRSCVSVVLPPSLAAEDATGVDGGVADG